MITSKKLFSLLTFIIILSLDLYAQSGWVQQNSGITGNITFIEAVDANYAFVGNPGYKTTNGGTTWFSTSAPSISEMQMINGQTGYSVGYSPWGGDPFKTTNGGLNWTILTAGAPLYSLVSFINENTGLVGGLHDMDYLDVFMTTNGGINWIPRSVSIAPWPDYIQEFTEIKILSANVIYVAYYVFQQLIPPLYTVNYFKKSTDGGTWFSTMMWDSNTVFYETAFPSANTGFIITAGGGPYKIIKSVNDNWGATISLTTSYPISGIEFPSVNTGYAVCAGGVMYKTTNGGTSWYTLNLGTTRGLRDVKFINELTGWVVGDSGLILKTTTGGEPPVFNSISGTVRYQDNNEPVTSGYVKAIRYDSSTYTIITVDSAQIQSNGTYILQNCPPITLDIMAYENDEELLSFVPTYYVSTIYWQYATHVRPDSNLTNINIGAKRTVNPSGNLHISGYVFSNEPSDNTALKDAVIYARLTGSFKGYSISQQNGYYKVDSLPAGVYELIADRMGYTGESYVISLTSSSLDNINFYLNNVLVPVKNEEANIPDKYLLYQNYPNPFNPVTQIKFSIPKSSFVTLAVYDLLGREILKLVNEQLQSGTYSAKWYAENYPSGVYFYKLTAGDYVDAKKMILIK